MKREFLEGLKLDADTIAKIMAENGKDVEREKNKYADYEDIKAQLETANKTIEKFKDYDQTKADVEKYKAEAEKAQKDAAEKIAKMEVLSKIKDFTSGKNFVNDFTRNAINSKLEEALEKTESKGKSLEDLFNEITDGKTDILKDDKSPTPPVVAQMGGKASEDSGVMAAFKRMNPQIKLD